MTILCVALLTGGVGGLACGGRLSRLGDLRIGGWWLLGAALGLQAFLGHLPVGARWLFAVADCAAISAWCLRNRRSCGRHGRVAFVFIALGVSLNAVAIAGNAGMPVSPGALGAAGLAHMNVARGHLYKHLLMTSHSHLRFLADTLPLRLVHTVLSPGDVLMLIGSTTVVWAGTKLPARTTHFERTNPPVGHDRLPVRLNHKHRICSSGRKDVTLTDLV